MELKKGDYFNNIPDLETFNKLVRALLDAGAKNEYSVTYHDQVIGKGTLIWDKEGSAFFSSHDTTKEVADPQRFKRHVQISDVLKPAVVSTKQSPKHYAYNKGEWVMLVSTCNVYPHYAEAASILGLTNWKECENLPSIRNIPLQILNVGTFLDREIYGLETVKGEQILAGPTDFVKCEDPTASTAEPIKNYVGNSYLVWAGQSSALQYPIIRQDSEFFYVCNQDNIQCKYKCQDIIEGTNQLITLYTPSSNTDTSVSTVSIEVPKSAYAKTTTVTMFGDVVDATNAMQLHALVARINKEQAELSRAYANVVAMLSVLPED